MAPRFRMCGVLLLSSVALVGCATHAAFPISSTDFAAAKAFKQYSVYWAGSSLDGVKLTAADSLTTYSEAAGFRVYYGDCVRRSPLSSSGCTLPLQITTQLHQFQLVPPLGDTTNTTLHGVPAVIYNGGRSIELYTDFQVVDIVASTPKLARDAVKALTPFNRSVTKDFPAFPPPYYQPLTATGLTGSTAAGAAAGTTGATGTTGASGSTGTQSPPAALEPTPTPVH